MAYYLQIYCSHYGRGARPVAFGLLQGDHFLWDREDSSLRDWTEALNNTLSALPEEEVPVVFNADFEIKTVRPLLTKPAQEALEGHLDLFHAMKRRTHLVPLPSYRLDVLAKRGGFKGNVCVGDTFASCLRERVDVGEVIYENLKALAAVHDFYSRLKARQSDEKLTMETFKRHPLRIAGAVLESRPLYFQRDGFLYEERDGRFEFEADAEWLPYDDARKALVVETDLRVPSSFLSPPGFLVLALDGDVDDAALLRLIQAIRGQALDASN